MRTVMGKRKPDAQVVCSLCGKTVNGWASFNGGFYVRSHVAVEGGRRCAGNFRTDHQPVPR